jgi:hypothetical protein
MTPTSSTPDESVAAWAPWPWLDVAWTDGAARALGIEPDPPVVPWAFVESAPIAKRCWEWLLPDREPLASRPLGIWGRSIITRDEAAAALVTRPQGVTDRCTRYRLPIWTLPSGVTYEEHPVRRDRGRPVQVVTPAVLRRLLAARWSEARLTRSAQRRLPPEVAQMMDWGRRPGDLHDTEEAPTG